MLMAFDLDDTPPYGGAEMTGLSLYMYASDVAPQMNNTATKFKFYKMLVDVGSNTSSITAKDYDTWVMSSQNRYSVFNSENFDGYGSSTNTLTYTYIDALNNDGYQGYMNAPNIYFVDYEIINALWHFQVNGGSGTAPVAWQPNYMTTKMINGHRYVPLHRVAWGSEQFDDLGAFSYIYYFADEATTGVMYTDYSDQERLEQGYSVYPSPGTIMFNGSLFTANSIPLLKYADTAISTSAGDVNRGGNLDALTYKIADIPIVNGSNSNFWTQGIRYIGFNTSGVSNYKPEEFYTDDEIKSLGIGAYKIVSNTRFYEYPVKSGNYALYMENIWNSTGVDDISEVSNTGWAYSNFTTYADWDVQNTVAQSFNYPPSKRDCASGTDTDVVPLHTGKAQVVEIDWGAHALGGASGGIVDGDYIVLHDSNNRPHIFWFQVDASGGAAPTAAVSKIYAADSTNTYEVDITTGGTVAANAGALRTAISARSEFGVGTLTAGVFTVTSAANGYGEDPWDGGILGASPTTIGMIVTTRGRGVAYEHNTGSKICIDVNFKRLGDVVKQHLVGMASAGDYNSYKRSFILWFGSSRVHGRGISEVMTDYYSTEEPPVVQTIKEDKAAGASGFGWMFYRPVINSYGQSSSIKIVPIIYNSGDVDTASGDTVEVDATTTNERGIFVINESITNHAAQQFALDSEDGNLLKVYVDPEESHATLVVTDQENATLAVSRAPNNKKMSNNWEDAPPYMLMSTTNIGRVRSDNGTPNAAGEYTSDPGEGHTLAKGTNYTKSKESTMLIQSVTWTGFNMDIQNATQNQDLTVSEGIKIAGGDKLLHEPSEAVIVGSSTVGEKISPGQSDSYVSFGYSSKANILGGTTKYQLWNGFSTATTGYIDSIPDANIKIGFIDNASRHGRYITRNTFNDSAYDYGIGVNADSETNFATEGYTRNFRMKGFVNYNVDADEVGPHSGNRDIVKRENHLVAGRVIDIQNNGRRVLIKGARWAKDITKRDASDASTQTSSATNSFYGTGAWKQTLQTVRLYKYGKPYTTSYYKSSLVPTYVEYNLQNDILTMDFSQDARKNDAGVKVFGGSQADTINQGLYLSPEAYWVIWKILPYAGSTGKPALGQRSYNAIIPVSSDAGMVGMTWNESAVSNEFSTGTLYANKWSLAKTGASIFEQNTDYNYGVYEEPTNDSLGKPDGGYCGIDMMMEEVYNVINMDGLVTTGDVLADTTLNLLGQAHDPNLINRVTVDLTGGANPPFLLQEFSDEVPAPIEEFKIKPNEENPFLIDFEWSVESEDLWYGFLQIGNSTIDNQYTNSLVHIPLNEDGSKTAASSAVSATAGIIRYQMFTLTASVIKAWKYSSNDTGAADAIGANVTNDIEGAAGWTKHFTNDGTLTYNTSYIEFGNGDFESGGGYSNWSLVSHITPDNTPTHDEYIISKEGEYDVWLDTSGQVNARVYQSNGVEASPNVTIPPIELRGTAVIPMNGDTPTCVIVTVDANLRSNNAKLYINGKLEDQSGLALSSGSVNNWQINSKIANTTKKFNIGRRNYETLAPTTEKNAFDGKIEEIVLYETTIHPVSPENKILKYNPLHSEMTTSTSASSKSYVARLFMKDYHNIRGKTRDTVCSSGQISFKKAGFSLDTS